MNLHHTTGTPDWEQIKPSQRTSIQKVAAATHGLVTPPNIITFVGFALVIAGVIALVQQQFWTGLILLTIGRLLDVADGLVAEKTGTKSPLGEFLDASVDKFGTIFTIIAIFIAGVTYWWLVALLLLPQVIITFVAFYKKRDGVHVQPTRVGKISMALVWVGLVGLILIKALGLAWPDPVAASIYTLILLSTGLGLHALRQYSTGRD